MKAKISVPGPARVMYRVYLAALVLVLYTGFYRFHPFITGWRYPWMASYTLLFNFLMGWLLALTAFVYLYYATLGRPEGWEEPLGAFRMAIAILSILWFILLFAAYSPTGWLNGLVVAMGGTNRMYKVYELSLWFMMLINLIYIYARWVKSERFPRLFAPKADEAGDTVE